VERGDACRVFAVAGIGFAVGLKINERGIMVWEGCVSIVRSSGTELRCLCFDLFCYVGFYNSIITLVVNFSRVLAE
jgi:hypothetical protein